MKNFALCSDGRYSREKSMTDICDKMKLYVIIQMENFERLKVENKTDRHFIRVFAKWNVKFYFCVLILLSITYIY
jgi:hypothetical protein